MQFDTILAGGRVVLPYGTVEADLGLRQGRIAALGALSAASGERIDAKGLHILPGVIDSQVHFREPGLEHKENLDSGTRAAALGGVTSILEMPNTNPNTDSEAALADKLRRARGRAWVDHGFFVGATAANVAQLGTLEVQPGCAGVKIFMGSSTGTLLVDDPAVLEAVLRSGRRRVAVHSEDEARLRARAHLLEASGVTAHTHPEWRDVEAATIATRKLLALAQRTGRPVHVLHISTAEETSLLAEAKHIATCEVTPQHLTLAAPDCYDRLGNLARMNPPIRDARHREGLWHAVGQGIFDVIGSDHAPHSLEEKQRPYPESPSGMPGVQTLLPIMLEHVHAGRLSLAQLVELTAHGPARVYGIAGKGRIAVGYDADLVLVDLARREPIRKRWIASKCGWTPFDGVEVHGWPVRTILRGRTIVRDGEVCGDPEGQPLQFLGGNVKPG